MVLIEFYFLGSQHLMPFKVLFNIRYHYIIYFLIFITFISVCISFRHRSYFYPKTKVKEKLFLFLLFMYKFYLIQSIHFNVREQSSKLNSSSIQRAIVVFYSSIQEKMYLSEIRWLYRSWIEMIKYEPNEWRTDLIIFTEKYSTFFIELGCIANKIRINNEELPKCRIFIYLRVLDRHVNSLTKQQKILTDDSEHNLFHINQSRSVLLYENLRTYQYIDSVNIIAEGYPIYSYYDFILKTDIDVFITKQFSNYIPNKLQTLFFGRGGYSTEFNTRRLGRIARDMGWKYQNWTNIGSTWCV